MKSDRAIKLEKLRAKASPPNSDADRLNAISRCANMTDLGRPSRDFMRDQLREIESRNTDPAVTLRISAIRDRFTHSKAVKARRLERQERAEVEMANETTVEAETIETPESAPAQQQPDADEDPNQPKFVWPPIDIQFPPTVYEMGAIDMSQVADHLRRAGLKGHPPRLSSDELNERIIRAAIGQPLAPITLDLLQQISFGLQYERKGEDPLMPGDRFRFWPFVYLHGAVTYLALQRFGYDALKKAPPSLEYARSLLQKSQSELGVFDRLETIPDLERRAKQYAHLPGFPELIKEFAIYRGA